MDLLVLEKLKDKINLLKTKVSTLGFESYSEAFKISYAHNSTAIEGNTLTLLETKLLLEDKITVGGKNLKEVYEIINHQKAFEYTIKSIADGKPLNENIVKTIHQITMENIITGGIYRNEAVRITGASHKPPPPLEMFNQIKNFYALLEQKEKELDCISLSAWTHAEFVRIHPFIDGNGRTSRLLMNYQLMAGGFLPVNIKKENRLEYYETLDEYAVAGSLEPFALMIYKLEKEELNECLSTLDCENADELEDEI